MKINSNGKSVPDMTKQFPILYISKNILLGDLRHYEEITGKKYTPLVHAGNGRFTEITASHIQSLTEKEMKQIARKLGEQTYDTINKLNNWENTGATLTEIITQRKTL